jgi:hypothetical protein
MCNSRAMGRFSVAVDCTGGPPARPLSESRQCTKPPVASNAASARCFIHLRRPVGRAVTARGGSGLEREVYWGQGAAAPSKGYIQLSQGTDGQIPSLERARQLVARSAPIPALHVYQWNRGVLGMLNTRHLLVLGIAGLLGLGAMSQSMAAAARIVVRM